MRKWTQSRQLENCGLVRTSSRHASELTYSFFERRQPDTFLLLSLSRIVEQNPAIEDIQLPIGKDFPLWSKGAMRIFERVGQEEPKDEARRHSERSHEDEQPEPSRLSRHTTHMEDAVCQQLRTRLTELISKIKHHDSLRRLLPRIPRGQGPKPARNEARFGYTKEKSGRNEGGIIRLPCLERTDDAEEEELERQPLAWANAVEDHV